MSKGIRAIESYLHSNGITYRLEQSFVDCRDARRLPFDVIVFVGHRYGLIEFDGAQHFKQVGRFQKSAADFKKQQAHDAIKTKYCRRHKIPLLRISYLEEKAIGTLVAAFVRKLRKRGKVYMFSNKKLYKHLR